MTDQKKFCCHEIESLINDPESPLEYSPARRLYSLVSMPRAFRKKNELTVAFEITHCPLCGEKFPKNLSNEWFAIIENQFGITSILDEKIKKLPQEFMTDEWWIKRNL